MRISDWSSDVCSSDLDALWVVGTDHAGIATQMVVERQMEARQDKRTNYTREQFVEKVWEWKAESGGDRKSGVQGKSVSVRVDLGGRRSIKTKKKNNVVE